MSNWLVERSVGLLERVTTRRGFLAKSAVVGSAIAINPIDFLLKPQSAYAATCRCRGRDCACGSACCDGYTEFCCTIIGTNTCPSGTVAGGWWKADGSNYCGGPRYYIDCNTSPGSTPCSCDCANGDCNNRAACCINFRYGQCHQEIPSNALGPIMCRVVTCTPPWIFDPTCTTAVLEDNNTRFHDAACLTETVPATYPMPAPDARARTTGRLVSGAFLLSPSIAEQRAAYTFRYGGPGDVPVVGDWNGDGRDTVGVFRNGVWFLRNSLTSGWADLVFGFGDPGDIPVVGDWDGDGRDGIGVFRNGVWYLRNTPTTGPAEITVHYGDIGDRPITGRWSTRTRGDTIGIVRNARWYLRNSLTSGPADTTFDYGLPTDFPVVGDWDGDQIDTPGVVRGSYWHLRNSNTPGIAHRKFVYGTDQDLPIVGHFGTATTTNAGVAR